MKPNYNDKDRLFWHTSLVLELWEAARSRKPRVGYHTFGRWESGMEEILYVTGWIMERLEERLALGHYIHTWISFAEELAIGVSKHWRKHGAFENEADLAAIVFPLIREYSAEK